MDIRFNSKDGVHVHATPKDKRNYQANLDDMYMVKVRVPEFHPEKVDVILKGLAAWIELFNPEEEETESP